MNRELFSVFRASAVDRYVNGSDAQVFEDPTPPRAVAFLWLLLLASLGALAGGLLVPVPSLVSGRAVLTEIRTHPELSAHTPLLVALIPIQDLTQIKVGQLMVVNIVPGNQRFDTRVTHVFPRLYSSEDAGKLFAAVHPAQFRFSQPVALITAEFSSRQMRSIAPAHAGQEYDVRLSLGAESLYNTIVSHK